MDRGEIALFFVMNIDKECDFQRASPLLWTERAEEDLRGHWPRHCRFVLRRRSHQREGVCVVWGTITIYRKPQQNCIVCARATFANCRTSTVAAVPSTTSSPTSAPSSECRDQSTKIKDHWFRGGVRVWVYRVMCDAPGAHAAAPRPAAAAAPVQQPRPAPAAVPAVPAETE